MMHIGNVKAEARVKPILCNTCKHYIVCRYRDQYISLNNELSSTLTYDSAHIFEVRLNCSEYYRDPRTVDTTVLSGEIGTDLNSTGSAHYQHQYPSSICTTNCDGL